MKKTKIGWIVLAALALFLFVPPAGAEVKIALDCPQDLETCGTYVWSFHYSKQLETAGLKPKLYPRDALGGEDEKLDQVSQGLLEVSNSDLAKIGQLDPTILGFLLPYLFDSVEHFDRMVVQSKILDKINEKTAAKGVRVLSLIPTGDFSGLANSKKVVKSPADLKGLRIRAMDAQQAKYLEAWGASTVIIPWAEMYNALQTGVADGYLNAAVVPVMFKHAEVLKFFSDIKFVIPLRLAICSNDWFKKLNDKDKAAVAEAVKQADAANRAWQKKVVETGIDSLKGAKVDVYATTPEDRAKFAAVIRPIYGQVVPQAVADLFVQAADKAR